MTRVFPAAALAVSVLTLQALGLPALAADNLFPELRPSYPDEWAASEDNPLRFEAGIRYYHSFGEQNFSLAGTEQNLTNVNHAGEAHVRIDDLSTSTFLEATAGLGFSSSGSVDGERLQFQGYEDAKLGYAGADFGWYAFGADGAGGGIGPVVGYQYTNDTMDAGRAPYYVGNEVDWNADSPFVSPQEGDSLPNNLDQHAAKIGLAGRMDFGAIDLTGEASAMPYTWLTGTMGSRVAPGTDGAFNYQGSPISVNGFGYGASGKLLVGFHPTENLTIRVGGRASYVEGLYDATYEMLSVTPNPNPAFETDPDADEFLEPTVTRQGFISDNNPFSMFRYGGLLEITGRF